MREIKFRGKAKHNDKWYFGDLNYHESRKEHYILKDFGSFPAPIQDDTIGQYTEFKDKNGVKIYEGDVIECKNYYGKIKGKVVFEDGCWLVDYSNNFNSEFLTNCGNIIVVGNIHDNPQL